MIKTKERKIYKDKSNRKKYKYYGCTCSWCDEKIDKDNRIKRIKTKKETNLLIKQDLYAQN